MAYQLSELTQFLANIILPFIFVWVLTYAIMEKIKLLGENKQAHLLISIAIAFFFIGVPTLLNITSVIIPIVATLVIIAFCLMLIFGMLGIEFYSKEGGGKLKYIIAGILVLAGIIVILNIFGVFQKISTWLSKELIQFIIFLVIIIAVTAIVVGFKTKEGK
ncbi:MAG: hypothetical protein QXS07_00295 [Candidatus Pacearchaeota archaeon]